jgi:hypothetical protein
VIEKGGCVMKTRKMFRIVGLFLIAVLFAFGSQAWAGGPLPPEATVFHGPEIWGSVVIYCGTSTLVVVRVKRVVDCNVETQTLVDPAFSFGCPSDDPNAPLGWSMPVGPAYKFFGLPGTPYITKVQNWKKDGNIFSFDAQFKFWE